MTLLVLALASLIIILVFTKNNFSKSSHHAPVIDIKNIDKENTLRELWSNKKLLALSTINIVTAILMALLGASFTQLALSYNLDMGLIGLFIALNNIVIGVTQVPFGHFADSHNKFKLTVVSGLVIPGLVIFLPLIGNIWEIAVLIVILGIFTALNLAASTALSVVLGREVGMSSTMGFLGSANSAGTIVGYLILGGIADLFGINSTFYFTGSIFLLGIALFYILWMNQETSDPMFRLNFNREN